MISILAFQAKDAGLIPATRTTICGWRAKVSTVKYNDASLVAT